MDTLGSTFKSAREKLGLKQSDVASKVGVDTSTISRIERGGSTKNTELIYKIAQVLQIEKDQVNNFVGGEEITNVGFGHCIWAAPMITLFTSRSLDKFMFTSFGEEWREKKVFQGYNQRKGEILAPVDKKTLEGFPSNFQKRYSIEVANYKPFCYHAWDLLEFLELDELDMIAIPGDLYQDYRVQAKLIRLASIMYSFEGGASLGIILKEDDALGGPLSNLKEWGIIKDSPKGKSESDSKTSQKGTREEEEEAGSGFGKPNYVHPYLKEYLSQEETENKLHLFYVPDTISDQQRRSFLDDELSKFKDLYNASIQEDKKLLEIEKWPIETNTLEDMWKGDDGIGTKIKEADKAQKKALFMVVIWEPHLSWIQGELKDTGYKMCKFELKDLFKSSNRIPAYFTFDIMVSRAKYSEKFANSSHILDFVQELDAQIKEFNNTKKRIEERQRKVAYDKDIELHEVDIYSDLTTEKEIFSGAMYLNMRIEEYYKAISHINFDLKLYPEWLLRD